MQTDGTGIELPFQPCPKCKKSVITRFQFCPFCGVELSIRFNADELSQLFEAVDTSGRGTHERARDRLREMGRKLGYQAYSGYGIPIVHRRSRIDALWFSGDKIVAAFAVHSKRQNLGLLLGYRDREELAALQAQEKFLVNVSIATGRAFFHRLRRDSSIEYAQVSGEAYLHIEDTRKTYRKSHERWTPEEDGMLARQHREGIQIAELAEIHQRTPWAIQLRLERLGLVPPHNSQG
jgi:hypothetical protein